MPKFIELQVERTETAKITVEVPDDFDAKSVSHWKWQEQVGQICEANEHELFWDNQDWEHNVSVVGYEVLSQHPGFENVDGVLTNCEHQRVIRDQASGTISCQDCGDTLPPDHPAEYL